jgi:hypothetical protein
LPMTFQTALTSFRNWYASILEHLSMQSENFMSMVADSVVRVGPLRPAPQ